MSNSNHISHFGGPTENIFDPRKISLVTRVDVDKTNTIEITNSIPTTEAGSSKSELSITAQLSLSRKSHGRYSSLTRSLELNMSRINDYNSTLSHHFPSYT